ncbi:MAG: hypothetical protein L3J50_08720 [Emcibacter sp.]|nr:hypothetical protein [Emcibacter sp.]
MPDTPPSKPQKSFLQRLRTYFLTGLVVASPVGITIYLALAFIDLIDRNIKPLIPAAFNP